MTENEEELNSLLMKVKEESEKAGLKLKIKALRSWPVHPKGNQSWIFIGRTDAEAETPILWVPDAKSWLIGKDPDAGKDWRWEEKGTTEDEMAGWHHRLNGQEFEYTPRVGDRQGGLACCSPWSQRVGHDWATEVNWTEDHGIQSYHFMAIRWGKSGNSDRLYFLGLQNHCWLWLQPRN